MIRASHRQPGFLAALPLLPSPPFRDDGGRIGEGTSIGPWRLLHELGQGGMSTVWLAERVDGQLHRKVALKLPHSGAALPSLIERMARRTRITLHSGRPGVIIG